jgi:hypothetical protein
MYPNFQKLRKESDFYDMKCKILSISRHYLYKKFISKSDNSCLKCIFRLFQSNSITVPTHCIISKNGSTKFYVNDKQLVRRKCCFKKIVESVDSECYDQIKNLLIRKTVKSREADLNIINTKINEIQKLQRMLFENMQKQEVRLSEIQKSVTEYSQKNNK